MEKQRHRNRGKSRQRKNYSNEQSSILINQIVKQFTDRSRKNIKEWRNAIKRMEDPYYPTRRPYIELARELEMDLHYLSQKQIRIMSAMASPFVIVDREGAKREEATTSLETPWFNKTMECYFESNFTGTELLEATEIESGRIIAIEAFPKGRLIPERKEVKLSAHLLRGTRWDTEEHADYMFELGQADKFGLMVAIAPQIIFKRNAQQAWARFADLFGMPFRMAKTNKSDKAHLDLLEAMLAKMGQAAYGVFPEGTTVELTENNTRDAYQVYDKQIERCNSEISKAIVGGTMISDDGSSRSQSEVHYKVSELIIKADMKAFSNFCNFYLIPKLIKLGYPFQEGDRFKWDMTEKLGKKEQWEITQGVLKHYEVEEEWITRTYGIPVTKRKEATSPTNGLPENFTNGQWTIHQPTDHKEPIGGLCCGELPIVIASTASDLNEWEQSFNELFTAIFQGKAPGIPFNAYLLYAGLLNKAFLNGFNERLKAIDYDSPDHYKAAMYQASVFRFSAAASWQQVTELNALRRKHSSFDAFSLEAEKIIGKKTAYLYTEFVTAEATAQNAANWLRQVEEKDLFDLQYMTMRDKRVRPSHQVLEGTTAPVDHPVWNTIYPTNGYGDRCEVIQVRKTGKITLKPIPDDAVAKGFKRNPGKVDHIFDTNHSYYKEFPSTENLKAQVYGLQDTANINRSSFDQMPQSLSEDDFRNWYEILLQEKGQKNTLHFEDFFKRSIALSKTTVEQSLPNPQLNVLPELGNILATPDEVWADDQQLTYVKAYQDGWYTVTAQAKDNKIQIQDWQQSMTQEYRKGILMKKSTRY